MPSKTKTRKFKGNRRHRKGKGTRSQRGGDWMHTLSFGTLGTADDPTTPSSSSWLPDFFKSDPNKPAFDWTFGLSKPSETYTAPTAYTAETSSTSGLSNSVFAPDATTSNSSYSGGKKSKSRSCHRKHRHKHTKSCSK